MIKSMTDPETGEPMERGTRPVTISFGGFSETVEMPGWYSEAGEGVHSGEDMAISDAALARLKERVKAEALPETAVSGQRKRRHVG